MRAMCLKSRFAAGVSVFKTIYILEDHPTSALVTEDIFKSILGEVQVFYFEELSHLLKADPFEIDILVSDLSLPDCTPTEVVLKTASRFAAVPRVYFSGLQDDSVTKVINDTGGLFLTKNSTYKTLIESAQKYLRLDVIDTNYAVTRNNYQSYIYLPGTHKPLTIKQAQVMEQISKGLSGKEIAKLLGMSPDTVNAHVKEAFNRLGVQNRIEAVDRFKHAKKLANRLYGSQVDDQLSPH